MNCDSQSQTKALQVQKKQCYSYPTVKKFRKAIQKSRKLVKQCEDYHRCLRSIEQTEQILNISQDTQERIQKNKQLAIFLIISPSRQ